MKARRFMFVVVTVATASFATIPAIAQQAPAAQNGQQNPGKSVLENPAAAMAQMQAAAAAKIKEAASQPTPRTSDGHPDLTGYWTPPVDLLALLAAGGRGAVAANGSTTRPLVGSESQEHAGNIAGVAARKADTALRPSYKPEFQGQADKNFEKAAYSDPAYKCMPQGVPRMGAPAEIVQTPQAMYFMYAGLIPSVPNPYRIIPIDGRKHDQNADPMADGDAVGHWEGDTLVVDVVNLDPDTWLDGDGSFHDGNLHVIERLTRQGNTLRYEVTVDDPTMFTKPFSPKPTMLILAPAGQHAPQDYPCVEMDQGHLKTDERH